MKTAKILAVLLIISVLSVFILPCVQATVISNPDLYDPSSGSSNANVNTIKQMGSKMWGVLANIGATISVVVIAIIGLRYMIGSIEQRAQYKETMWPVIIGCIMVGGISIIVEIIYNMSKSIT